MGEPGMRTRPKAFPVDWDHEVCCRYRRDPADTIGVAVCASTTSPAENNQCRSYNVSDIIRDGSVWAYADNEATLSNHRILCFTPGFSALASCVLVCIGFIRF